MKTVTIQIGNTDDKLGQVEWAAYVIAIKTQILSCCKQVHFFGGSTNWERWQNCAWVIEIEEDKIQLLKARLTDIRSTFSQDSVAYTEGTTEFI